MHITVPKNGDRIALMTGDPRHLRLRFSSPPNRIRATNADRQFKRRKVLLLGANGFVGVNILHALLADDRVEQVCAIVRPRRDATGNQRIAAQAHRYGVQLDNLTKLTVLEGEYTKPNMGLQRTEFDTLKETIDVVIDAAGATNHAFSYFYYRRESVLPLLRLMEFCLDGRLKTLEVVGSVASELFQTKRDFHRHGFFHCGYTRMKWVVKNLVLDANSQGVPVHVCLAPFVIGGENTNYRDPGGYYSVYRMFELLDEIKKFTGAHQLLPLAQCDALARALVDNALSDNPMPMYYPVMPFTAADMVDRYQWESVRWREVYRTLWQKYPLASLRGRVSGQKSLKDAVVARALFTPWLMDRLRDLNRSTISVRRVLETPAGMSGSDVFASCVANLDIDRTQRVGAATLVSNQSH